MKYPLNTVRLHDKLMGRGSLDCIRTYTIYDVVTSATRTFGFTQLLYQWVCTRHRIPKLQGVKAKLTQNNHKNNLPLFLWPQAVFFLFVFLTLIMPGSITNNFVCYFGMRSLLGVSLHLKNHNSVITEGV